jgi:hypothetical protein
VLVLPPGGHTGIGLVTFVLATAVLLLLARRLQVVKA